MEGAGVDGQDVLLEGGAGGKGLFALLADVVVGVGGLRGAWRGW